MKYQISEVSEAIQRTIAQLLLAIIKANFASDRMASRNLEMRVEQMKQLLKDVKGHEEYITQPRFEKYFMENPNADNSLCKEQG